MTARPQDAALLPLPWCLTNLRADDQRLVFDYTRACVEANVTAALASAQAREEELQAEVAKAQASVRFGLATQDELRAEVERWRGHYDDMSRRAVEAVDRREDAEARAERLEEALRELFDDYKRLADSGDAGFWKLEDTYAGKKALAALSTNAATQTGETT